MRSVSLIFLAITLSLTVKAEVDGSANDGTSSARLAEDLTRERSHSADDQSTRKRISLLSPQERDALTEHLLGEYLDRVEPQPPSLGVALVGFGGIMAGALGVVTSFPPLFVGGLAAGFGSEWYKGRALRDPAAIPSRWYESYAKALEALDKSGYVPTEQVKRSMQKSRDSLTKRVDELSDRGPIQPPALVANIVSHTNNVLERERAEVSPEASCRLVMRLLAFRKFGFPL